MLSSTNECSLVLRSANTDTGAGDVSTVEQGWCQVTMDRGPHTRAALHHHYLVTSTHNTHHNTTPCTTRATDATPLSFRDEILLTSCIATPPLEYNLHDTRFWVLAAHRFVSSVTTETRAGRLLWLLLLGRALIRFKFVSLGPRKLGFMTPESRRAL